MSVGEFNTNSSSSLQGLWHLSNVNDSSKNAYNLTNNNTVTFDFGKFGNCCVLNGTNQSLSITNASAPNLYTTGDQSIIGWIYPTTFSGARSAFSNSNGTVSAGFSVQTEAASGKLEFRSFKSGDDQSVTSSLAFTLNQWNFFAVLYTNSGQNVTLFLNGNRSTGTFSRAMVSSTGDTAIGKLGGFAGQFFQGRIDEIAFFNSALTDAQIKNYYAWARGQRGGTV